MREIQIGNLRINPFEYNPGQNKIIIHTDIKFIIHFQLVWENLEIISETSFWNAFFEIVDEPWRVGHGSARDPAESEPVGAAMH